MEFLNVEEPELVGIWMSSIGLQVDGAADDVTDDSKESEQKRPSQSGDEMVADNQPYLPDGSEGQPATAAAVDEGMGTAVAAVEVSTEVSVSNCSVSDSVALASVTSGESTMPVVSKPVDMHLPTDTDSAANLNKIKDSESLAAMPQLPSGVNMPETASMPSTSEPQPTISKALIKVPVEVTASLQCIDSEAAQTLACSVAGEAPAVTTAVTATLASSLASELQSSSACRGSPLASAANSTSLELMSQNPHSENVSSARPVINQSAAEVSALSLASAVVSSESCPVTVSVTLGSEMMAVQSGVLPQCPVATSALSSDFSAASTLSQVVESYSVAASAVAVDSTSVLSIPETASVATSAAVVVPVTSHMADGSNVAATNQAFNSTFHLRPELQHASMQPFIGQPPRRMYLPPDFHMQQRMMQHGMPPSEGMMIPAEQLPHVPPPPYPNKQFAGQQTFWVRQQHPSGMPPEWIRHSGEFGPRPLPPNLGSHEWSRAQMMPSEWSSRQRMQQEWVYFPQQPHHPSQAPNQWVRTPYSNMPGFQLGSGDASSMPADAYNSGYPLGARNTAAGSAGVAQDGQVAQGIKSPGSATPRPSSHHSASPVPASPASARADIASPQSRSHTPRSLSRSSTPAMSGASGMSHTPDHVMLPAATAASPHPHPSATVPFTSVSVMPTSSPVEQSAVPSSGCQAADHVGSLSSETSRPASASTSGSVPASESGTSQPSLPVVSGTLADHPAVPLSSAQLAASSHVPAENMMYVHRLPHGMPMSPEMRRMGPPFAGRYVAQPPQGMYVSGHPAPGTSGMTFYRVPSSAATTQSAIGALLNQQRAPIHYPTATQPPGAPVMESCYQLVHTPETYHSQRHTYSPAVTVAGPSGSVSGSFVLQHQHRGPAPPLSAESAGHQEVSNQTSMLPNSMQTPAMLRGPFRMPQQLGPGPVPLGMRLAGSAPPIVYGPQRPVPPPSKVRMIAAPEMRAQMIHIPRSSVAEFAGPAYRPRPPGEQPLLLEDLLEQVCYM